MRQRGEPLSKTLVTVSALRRTTDHTHQQLTYIQEIEHSTIKGKVSSCSTAKILLQVTGFTLEELPVYLTCSMELCGTSNNI